MIQMITIKSCCMLGSGWRKTIKRTWRKQRRTPSLVSGAVGNDMQGPVRWQRRNCILPHDGIQVSETLKSSSIPTHSIMKLQSPDSIVKREDKALPQFLFRGTSTIYANAINRIIVVLNFMVDLIRRSGTCTGMCTWLRKSAIAPCIICMV